MSEWRSKLLLAGVATGTVCAASLYLSPSLRQLCYGAVADVGGWEAMKKADAKRRSGQRQQVRGLLNVELQTVMRAMDICNNVLRSQEAQGDHSQYLVNLLCKLSEHVQTCAAAVALHTGQRECGGWNVVVVSEAVGCAVETVAAELGLKGLEALVRIGSAVPDVLYCPARVHLLLLVLLGKAAKHTDKGGVIEVFVNLREWKAGGRALVVAVRVTGAASPFMPPNCTCSVRSAPAGGARAPVQHCRAACPPCSTHGMDLIREEVERAQGTWEVATTSQESSHTFTVPVSYSAPEAARDSHHTNGSSGSPCSSGRQTSGPSERCPAPPDLAHLSPLVLVADDDQLRGMTQAILHQSKVEQLTVVATTEAAVKAEARAARAGERAARAVVVHVGPGPGEEADALVARLSRFLEAWARVARRGAPAAVLLLAPLLLEGDGYLCELVSVGSELLQRVQQVPAACVVLNVDSVLDTMGITKKMRALPGGSGGERRTDFASVPIVGITGEEGDARQLVGAGVSMHLVAPVETSKLLLAVRSAIDGTGLAVRPPAKEPRKRSRDSTDDSRRRGSAERGPGPLRASDRRSMERRSMERRGAAWTHSGPAMSSSPEREGKEPLVFNVLLVVLTETTRRTLKLMLESTGEGKLLVDTVGASFEQATLEAVQQREGGDKPRYQMVMVEHVEHNRDFNAPQLVRAVRNSGSSIPCIALIPSTASQTREQLACMEAGFDDVLSTPVVQPKLSQLLFRYLPVGSDAAAPRPAEREFQQPCETIIQVLVVEDDYVSYKMIKHLLKRAGCIVTLAQNGKIAVDMTLEQPYDVVLMDCDMPVMDGWEATRKIREREAGSGAKSALPIVAVTANAMRGDREKCLSAGMQDYLSKPVQCRELVDMVHYWAERSRRERFHRAPPGPGPGPGPSPLPLAELPPVPGLGSKAAAAPAVSSTVVGGTAEGYAQPGQIPFNPKVLLVEDSVTERLLMCRMMQREGCVVDMAVNGEQALTYLNEKHTFEYYDMVILDLRMLVKDGWETAREIRIAEMRSRRTRKLPIIAISSAHSVVERSKAQDAGMDDFVSKPVQKPMMKRVLDKWLGRAPEDPDEPRLASSPPPHPSIGSNLDEEGNDEKQPVDASELQGMTVLYAEDCAPSRLMLSCVLQNAQMSCTVVEHGEAALEMLQRREFDFVLLDIDMPIMGGVHTCKVMRSRYNVKCPIIAVTVAQCMPTANVVSKEFCLANGMDGYLVKPVKPNAVLCALKQARKNMMQNQQPPGMLPDPAIVGKILRENSFTKEVGDAPGADGPNGNGEGSSSASEATPAPADSKASSSNGDDWEQAMALAPPLPINLDKALEMVKGDWPFLLEILENFVQTVMKSMQRCKAGLAAKNFDTLAFEAHSMKGGSAMCACEQIHLLCIEMERRLKADWTAGGQSVQDIADFLALLDGHISDVKNYLQILIWLDSLIDVVDLLEAHDNMWTAALDELTAAVKSICAHTDTMAKSIQAGSYARAKAAVQNIQEMACVARCDSVEAIAAEVDELISEQSHQPSPSPEMLSGVGHVLNAVSKLNTVNARLHRIPPECLTIPIMDSALFSIGSEERSSTSSSSNRSSNSWENEATVHNEALYKWMLCDMGLFSADCCNDVNFMCSVMDTMLQTAHQQVTALTKAIDEKNSTEVSFHVHSLRGASLGIWAMRLATAAAELQGALHLLAQDYSHMTFHVMEKILESIKAEVRSLEQIKQEADDAGWFEGEGAGSRLNEAFVKALGPATECIQLEDIFSMKRAMENLGGQNDFLIKELLPAFLHSNSASLARIRACFLHQDLEQVGMACHCLRGSALNCGATQLAQVALEAERMAVEAHLDGRYPAQELIDMLLTKLTTAVAAVQWRTLQLMREAYMPSCKSSCNPRELLLKVFE